MATATTVRTVGSRPAVKTQRLLFARSGNLCAFPGCEQQLGKPEWDGVQAEVCHIRAQGLNGPRYDVTYPDPDHYDNLIVLCPNHHNEVDYLRPGDFSVEALEEMKAAHEASVDHLYKLRWWELEGHDLERYTRLLVIHLRVEEPTPNDRDEGAPGEEAGPFSSAFGPGFQRDPLTDAQEVEDDPPSTPQTYGSGATFGSGITHGGTAATPPAEPGGAGRDFDVDEGADRGFNFDIGEGRDRGFNYVVGGQTEPQPEADEPGTDPG
jgi:hypothetical protein